MARVDAVDRVIPFSRDRRRTVIDEMARLARDRDGWLNLQPDVDSDGITGGGPSLARVFSARGPTVPLASWVPGRARRGGGFDDVSIGLQHPGGRRAVIQLREAGIVLGTGWRVLVDHPRRGLVVSVPDETDHEATLTWLMDAADHLSPTPLPTGWHAGVYVRR